VNICAQETVKKKLAVYVSGRDTDASIKKVFGSKLVGAIANSNGYAAVERTAEFLDALSTENDYQTSGEVRDNQIASLGQKFGVRFVIVADINEVFDEYFISSRLINVETGLVERSFDANGPAETMSQLIALADRIANGMIIQPEQAEIQRIAKEKQRAEDQKRLEEQRRRQQQEEYERQQRQKREQLRQTAINNLMRKTGYKCYQLGNIIVMDALIHVDFEFNEAEGRVKSITTAPAGWRIADPDVLRSVMQSGRYNRGVQHVYLVSCNVRAYPYRKRKFNDNKKLGFWTIACFDLDMYYREAKTIGETVKQKGSKIPRFDQNSDSYITFFYRPMFSESEIQAEISRIK